MRKYGIRKLRMPYFFVLQTIKPAQKHIDTLMIWTHLTLIIKFTNNGIISLQYRNYSLSLDYGRQKPRKLNRKNIIIRDESCRNKNNNQ